MDMYINISLSRLKDRETLASGDLEGIRILPSNSFNKWLSLNLFRSLVWKKHRYMKEKQHKKKTRQSFLLETEKLTMMKIIRQGNPKLGHLIKKKKV